MIRQAMILAAGRGERMMPLTKDLPKPLLPLGNTTLIHRHLENLAKAGIERVVINVHYLADRIIGALGKEQFGMQIQYSEETELLETAGGIKAALPLLGTEPFLIVNGDILTDFPFDDLLRRVSEDRLPHLVMVKNPDHHPEGDFAVTADGVLVNLGDNKLTYAGIGVYSAPFFEEMAEGKLMLRPLFDQAVLAGRLFGSEYPGIWHDVGTPERYEMLKAQWK